MHSAILSFLPEIIGNPHFIAVMVDVILSVYITHPSFRKHNIKALDVVDLNSAS